MTDSEQEVQRENPMEINPNLVDAARSLVRERGVQGGPVDIPGYRGMLVAKADDPTVQAITFFQEAGERYAVGAAKA